MPHSTHPKDFLAVQVAADKLSKAILTLNRAELDRENADTAVEDAKQAKSEAEAELDKLDSHTVAEARARYGLKVPEMKESDTQTVQDASQVAIFPELDEK